MHGVRCWGCGGGMIWYEGYWGMEVAMHGMRGAGMWRQQCMV